MAAAACCCTTTEYIGFSGSGSLTQLGGMHAVSGNVYLGYNAGSSGVVTVAGAGSTWNSGSSLLVGCSGGGTLNIGNGGTVQSDGCSIGYNAGSSGVVTVDGPGSTWNCTTYNSFNVGASGSGTLNIINGGTVNTSGWKQVAVGSNGVVNVDGTGSAWNTSIVSGMVVNGTMNISRGGVVDSYVWPGCISIGGDVTVDGSGSTWNAPILSLGGGTLNISNGGAVNVSALPTLIRGEWSISVLAAGR